LPLEVLYEDDDLIAINKPSGMVVHPGKGHWAGTLTSALAFHFQQLSQVGGAHRPGIVHRLDRDTSGVIVVAKNDQSHLELARQFEHREVEKEYFAICRGSLDRDRDWIRQPIGLHPVQREKMAIRADHASSRTAETFFEVEQRWKGHLSFRVFPKTGRTHQIRVHLAHIGCPVICDPLYSGFRQLTWGDIHRQPPSGSEDLLIDRLALHARRLTINHPTTRVPVEFTAEVPAVLLQVVDAFSSSSERD
jgi:23S rRNA pseudouridine1911/1915/1917 synthase